jgi:hypothetical protein
MGMGIIVRIRGKTIAVVALVIDSIYGGNNNRYNNLSNINDKRNEYKEG